MPTDPTEPGEAWARGQREREPERGETDALEIPEVSPHVRDARYHLRMFTTGEMLGLAAFMVNGQHSASPEMHRRETLEMLHRLHTWSSESP
jgi:hypothetical protein